MEWLAGDAVAHNNAMAGSKDTLCDPTGTQNHCDLWPEPDTPHRIPLKSGGAGNAKPCFERLGGVMGSVPEANNRIRLGTFLSFDYVEFDLIAFFERFIPVQLDC